MPSLVGMNIKDAIYLCENLGLNRLVIPKASLFRKKNNSETSFIVEEKLHFEANETHQKNFLESGSTNLDLALKQLTDFIVYTGFHDVVIRNIAILSLENSDEVFIGLYDLEDLSMPQTDIWSHMKNVYHGLFGNISNNSTGLSYLLSIRHKMLMRMEVLKQIILCFVLYLIGRKFCQQGYGKSD